MSEAVRVGLEVQAAVDLDHHGFDAEVQSVVPRGHDRSVVGAVHGRSGHPSVIALPRAWFVDAIEYVMALAESQTHEELRQRTPRVYLD